MSNERLTGREPAPNGTLTSARSVETMQETARPRNYILSQMPEANFVAIAKHLVPMELPLHFELSRPKPRD